MKELDDLLEHSGVKGMKWGVIRARAAKGIKNHVKKRNAKEKVGLEKYHEKSKGKKGYSKRYKKNLKVSKTHIMAVRKTKAQISSIQLKKVELALKLTAAVTPATILAGRKTFRAFNSVATNPDVIRAGKNIIKGMQGSPFRYVDGSKMKNVI